MPFSIDAFFYVFAVYNKAVWPAHLVAYGLAGLALLVLLLRPAAGVRVALAVLGVFWLWNGALYHLTYFARINPAAYGFGVLFLAQGLLFLIVVLRRGEVERSLSWTPATVVGAVLIFYSVVVYSVIGWLTGHVWPRAPMFGVAPCPTTIFTFGLLMLLPRPIPVWLMIIPLIWAMIGSTAAVFLGVPEDFGLLAAGIIAAVWLTLRIIGAARRAPATTG